MNKGKLLALERQARNKKHFVVANNICISLADESDSEMESYSLLDRVINCEGEDTYNRFRAAVNKANMMGKNRRLHELTAKEMKLIGYAYSFTYLQRIDDLFDECHRVIWAILNNQGHYAEMFRLFRYSSFLWRVRGEGDREWKYINELEKIYLDEIVKENNQADLGDLKYFQDRKRSYLLKEENGEASS